VTPHGQIGLLWAICRWLADNESSIESLPASMRVASPAT
jgi:hypothetical protein